MFQKIQEKHNWKRLYNEQGKELKLTYKIKEGDLTVYRLSD